MEADRAAAAVQWEKDNAAFAAGAQHVFRRGLVCEKEQLYRDAWNELSAGNPNPIYGQERTPTAGSWSALRACASSTSRATGGSTTSSTGFP
jgi:hypothetical protein